MSNAVFPSLPGLSWNIIKSPIWKTHVQESVSGKELRSALMNYPLYKWSLNYEVLRAEAAYTELQQLMGFFNARKGAFDSFLYPDPDDNTVTNYQFGIGDGSTTGFQLARVYGSFVEPVQNVNTITNIKVAGVIKTNPANYTINSTGFVTFAVAPTAGQAITWSGTYYWRVRFLQDVADFDQFMRDLWTLKKLEFRSVKL